MAAAVAFGASSLELCTGQPYRGSLHLHSLPLHTSLTFTSPATTMSQRLLRPSALLRQRPVKRWICPQCRFYTSEPPPASPLLLKLRTDLKTAMKAKDTARLNVLRSLLAEVTNAAKTQNPIKSDMQLLSLLRKRQAAAKAASEEFKTAGREDLVEREEGQVKILDEYAGDVEVMGVEDVREAVRSTIEQLRAKGAEMKAGPVMKAVFAEGGSLEGKNVERSMVPGVVKELLGKA